MNRSYIVEGHVNMCRVPLVSKVFSNNDLVAGAHLLAASEENERSTTTHSGGYKVSLENQSLLLQHRVFHQGRAAVWNKWH